MISVLCQQKIVEIFKMALVSNKEGKLQNLDSKTLINQFVWSQITNSIWRLHFDVDSEVSYRVGQGLLLDGQEGSGKIFQLFHTGRYAKIAIISFVAIPISSLLTKFQLNILTIQALATLQTLLQSLKQNL